jgi:hypothetical protein
MSLQMSSSQTIGPYLHIGTDWLITTEMAGPKCRANASASKAGCMTAMARP